MVKQSFTDQDNLDFLCNQCVQDLKTIARILRGNKNINIDCLDDLMSAMADTNSIAMAKSMAQRYQTLTGEVYE
jgi:hypothetical protein